MRKSYGVRGTECTATLQDGAFCSAPGMEGLPFPLCTRHAIQTHLAVAGMAGKRMAEYVRAGMPQPDTTRQGKRTYKSLVDLGSEVGPCLYAIRMADGLIKIGYSQNVISRIRWLGGLESILALRSGTFEEEQAIHRRLKPYRALRREYYHPVPKVLAEVEALSTD